MITLNATDRGTGNETSPRSSHGTVLSSHRGSSTSGVSPQRDQVQLYPGLVLGALIGGGGQSKVYMGTFRGQGTPTGFQTLLTKMLTIIVQKL